MIEYVWWTPLLLWVVGWNQFEQRQALFISFISKFRRSNTFVSLWADIKIWNVTHHRLVASGVHVKMPPSQPLKAALWRSVWSSMENWNIEIHDTHWQTQYPLYLFSRSHFYVRHADPSNLMKLYNKFGSRRKDGQTGDILSMPLLPITFLQEWRRNFN